MAVYFSGISFNRLCTFVCANILDHKRSAESSGSYHATAAKRLIKKIAVKAIKSYAAIFLFRKGL
jgi:hypothetical protein